MLYVILLRTFIRLSFLYTTCNKSWRIVGFKYYTIYETIIFYGQMSWTFLLIEIFMWLVLNYLNFDFTSIFNFIILSYRIKFLQRNFVQITRNALKAINDLRHFCGYNDLVLLNINVCLFCSNGLFYLHRRAKQYSITKG